MLTREEFASEIAALSDKEFVQLVETIIWLSAFVNNNPRAPAHWQADLCFDEAVRRGKPELYTQAYEQAKASAA